MQVCCECCTSWLLKPSAAPEILTASDTNGFAAAHSAAANGHAGTSDTNGQVAAHFAAGNGHADVLRVLHELAPETFSVSDTDGNVAAHCAACAASAARAGS
eukprot:TRINITY_DN8304_c1_g2_i6.p1 TRINITY_DN8304_c1_g2~~TRINITY_DN8304_c1_g2_i6.p1  ORF type:complete len:102 (-),score=33.19 TRINITY_DN8304_c1_g2_i6:198-503(-)